MNDLLRGSAMGGGDEFIFFLLQYDYLRAIRSTSELQNHLLRSSPVVEGIGG